MNTNVQLTAEQIAQSCEVWQDQRNRQAIEDAFERQTPPDVFIAAVARADGWPRCRNTPERLYGVQYAYLLEFLICAEIKRRQMGGA